MHGEHVKPVVPGISAGVFRSRPLDAVSLWGRFSRRKAIELRRRLVEHLRHGGDYQIVLGREMTVEPAMREPGLCHHTGDANAMRALRPYRVRGFLEDPGPGPLLVFGIIPYGPPLYDYSNLIIWP